MGKAILITGGPCAGKSTIAASLHKKVKLHKFDYIDFDSVVGELTTENCKVRGGIVETQDDFGLALTQFVDALHAQILKRNFIVDGWLPPTWQRKLRDALEFHDVFSVRLICSNPHVLEQRDAMRVAKKGNAVAPAGLATEAASYKDSMLNDLIIDTAVTTVKASVAQIRAAAGKK